MASAAKPDADEKEPRADDALASGQLPTADLPWRFGQISAVCQFQTLGAHELKAGRTRHQQPNPAYKRSPVDGMRVPLVLTLVLTCFLRVLDALRLGQLQNALVVPANRAITFARGFL